MFVLRDFVYYWIHRAEHTFAGLWASHLVHHSPTKLSYTTAIRMPWMEALYKPALALWAPLLGFHPGAFAAIGALVLLVGQYQHTEGGRWCRFLRGIFVIPETHRVHHGSNERYMDKNFGSMLVIWDRLFGTYVPETEPVRLRPRRWQAHRPARAGAARRLPPALRQDAQRPAPTAAVALLSPHRADRAAPG